MAAHDPYGQQPGYPPHQGYQPYPQQQPYPYGYPPQPPRSGRTGILVVAGVAIVAMIAVLGVAAFFIVRSRAGSDPVVAPSGSEPAPPDPDAGLAAGSGPVKVTIYVDYQCPPCSAFEKATGDALVDYVAANRITLSIRPVAFIDDRSKNRYSTRAAAAAACSYDTGKLLDFHKHLLENQPAEDTAGPTDDELVTAGADLGLGTGFAGCVTGKKRVGWVRESTAAAKSDGVTSVPAAFVNDRKVGTGGTDLVTAITAAG